MNWLSVLLRCLTLIQPAVSAVEVIAEDDAAGATKQQMAIDAITAGTPLAETFLSPADQQKASAVSALLKMGINATVTDMNNSGTMPTKIAATVVDAAAAGGAAVGVIAGAIPAAAVTGQAAPGSTTTV